MLLYNHRKEFIGIDEDDLSSLDFQNISQLQDESHDFADLFVKKPGYIHNFKNFSWIDFILHSETDEAKAIIHAKGVNYSCSLHITAFNFTNDEKGYAVSIRKLRALKGAEGAQATKDLEAAGGIQSTPAPAPQTSFQDPSPELNISLNDIKMDEIVQKPSVLDEAIELPNFEESIHQELSEPDPLDIPEPFEADFLPPLDNDLLSVETNNELDQATENEFGAPSTIDFNAPLDIEDDLSNDSFSEPIEEVKSSFETEKSPDMDMDEAPMLGDYVSSSSPSTEIEGSEHLSELVSSGTYKYNPNIAADELGLPVDLIEEFIGDFIDQAYEFKDDLYASVNGSDFDNVQVLSHKLKGVAANLRVEDAFDVLSVVNTSKNIEEIIPNINAFYTIIAKLGGKEVLEETPVVAEPLEVPLNQVDPTPLEPVMPDEEDYNFGLKASDDEPLSIDEGVNAQEHNDDLYDDLLVPQDSLEDEVNSQESTSLQTDVQEDIYDDLLAVSDLEAPILETNILEDTDKDDIYDDLLATPELETTLLDESISDNGINTDENYDEPNQSEEPNTEIIAEVEELNYDVQFSADQLGIPVDIVKDFVQDFKEQVSTHHVDFQNAINTQNISEINQTATLLKGMSDNLRLNEISEVLKELQSETNINNTAHAIAKVQAYADQL
ncbi:Hpt domain-containing protein [Sulfurimonas sp. MAG313]|nr:Hpt domain-containing protein [Sulfurimonas sp. MAG313]MDF1880689.1 Hpt domain-containing protein [Sulfurimonas sp. MAG313]